MYQYHFFFSPVVPVCNDATAQAMAEQTCGEITDPSGLFAACSVELKNTFYAMCVTDICNVATACETIEILVQQCNAETGVAISQAWRDHFDCGPFPPGKITLQKSKLSKILLRRKTRAAIS